MFLFYEVTAVLGNQEKEKSLLTLETILPLLLYRFDAVIISSEVGYEKPDPKIFKAALGKVYSEHIFFLQLHNLLGVDLY